METTGSVHSCKGEHKKKKKATKDVVILCPPRPRMLLSALPQMASACVSLLPTPPSALSCERLPPAIISSASCIVAARQSGERSGKTDSGVCATCWPEQRERGLVLLHRGFNLAHRRTCAAGLLFCPQGVFWAEAVEDGPVHCADSCPIFSYVLPTFVNSSWL